MASLLPPETATIVFAHTPTGAVPAAYWWIDARFAVPPDARFALIPALRVVYVPIPGTSTFVAYDVGILTGLTSSSSSSSSGLAYRSGLASSSGLSGLSGLANIGREEFLELTGRVADQREREELGVRLRKVLETREAVQRLLKLNTPRDAVGLVRAMNPAAFDTTSSAASSVKGSRVSISSLFARAARVEDLINVAVIGIAFAVFFATTTTTTSSLGAVGLFTRVADCIGSSMYGTRDALGFVIASALKYGTVLLGSFYPRIAGVIARNRTLGCALSIALSALSVAGLPGLSGLSGLTGLTGLSGLGSYASTVSYATTETTIGCIGDIAETVRARQTGEIIASLVLILANIAANNASAVVVSADAFERLVVARFGTCLVPKTMLSALLALARARSGLHEVFAAYLEHMRLMGSITHRFAQCLVPSGNRFGGQLLLARWPRVVPSE